MHGYVVPSRIGTFVCTTLQLEFSVYSGKKSCKKKYVKNLELINKDVKKSTIKQGIEMTNPAHAANFERGRVEPWP